MGIATVAVYSEADAGALHVELADEARLIGPPPPRDSYLTAKGSSGRAQQVGAEAIHPATAFCPRTQTSPKPPRRGRARFIGPLARGDPCDGFEVGGEGADGAGTACRWFRAITAPTRTRRARRPRPSGTAIRCSSRRRLAGGGKGMRIVERRVPQSNCARCDRCRNARRLASFGDDQH